MYSGGFNWKSNAPPPLGSFPAANHQARFPSTPSSQGHFSPAPSSHGLFPTARHADGQLALLPGAPPAASYSSKSRAIPLLLQRPLPGTGQPADSSYHVHRSTNIDLAQPNQTQLHPPPIHTQENLPTSDTTTHHHQSNNQTRYCPPPARTNPDNLPTPALTQISQSNNPNSSRLNVPQHNQTQSHPLLQRTQGQLPTSDTTPLFQSKIQTGYCPPPAHAQPDSLPTADSAQNSQSNHQNPSRTADKLEADLLSEINSFTAATSGITSRGRGRGQGLRGGRGSRGGKVVRGGRGSRGGRGRGGHSNTGSRGVSPVEETPSQNTSFLPFNNLEDNENDEDTPANNENTPVERQQLEPHIMDELQKLELDKLRRRAVKYAHYKRLVPDDWIKLSKAYFQYQKEVYLIIYKRKLHVNPPLEHLGLLSWIKGSTCYNNFCKYDEVASKTFTDSSIHVNERMSLCGELWDELDQETQDMWKDREFVEAKKKLLGPAETETQPDDIGSLPLKRKAHFKIHKWARRMKKDMQNLSTAHNLEGFFVIVPRDPESGLLVTGGSLLGDQFVDMISCRVPNPCPSFYSFVSGQAAIQQISGKEPPAPVQSKTLKTSKQGKKGVENPEDAYSNGDKRANLDAVREQLAKAIYDATHGVHDKGLPGTHTKNVLSELDVILQVKNKPCGVTPEEFCGRLTDMKNRRLKRILMVLEEGWVELTGPPVPQVEENGFASIGGAMLNSDSDASGNSARNSGAPDKERTVVRAGSKWKKPAKKRHYGKAYQKARRSFPILIYLGVGARNVRHQVVIVQAITCALQRSGDWSSVIATL
ncbi:hypothetical protein PTTG_25475 [Puccinia triticina 1-1 BBBD Race 1]|uniref:Uncharacterized protein n=1 Tax=Puccinia triticina (isolate 1-1 / race 1 (BBBD)) TaxID=630390 RepID=A0A180H3I4_PUCT1|nr:hypothetical protein PTTG_25475 [Puccinia triticina 1-1 BBBD Race 1]